MKTPYKKFRAEAQARKVRARRLKASGKSLAEIGRILGMSRQRVHQILAP